MRQEKHFIFKELLTEIRNKILKAGKNKACLELIAMELSTYTGTT